MTDESSAIHWLGRQLARQPQTFPDLQPRFLQAIEGWEEHERALELREILK